MAHWWTFLTKKNTKKNLWLIDDHLWPKKHQENFMTIIIAYARACDIIKSQSTKNVSKVQSTWQFLSNFA